MMLKMQTKIESSGTKLAEDVGKLIQGFQKFKSEFAITKNANRQLLNHFVKQSVFSEKMC